MRRADAGVTLTDAQQRAADAGLKPLMPIGGRPFLDYVLSSLADAGVTRAGLVVAPDHAAAAAHYAASPPTRLTLDFVVQREPLGTADAVLAAESWTEGHPFLVMNGDNLYPVRALTGLASLLEPGLPAFDAGELVRSSNIPDARIRAFALIEVDADGYLTGIVEKPATPGLPPEGVLSPEAVLPPEGGSHRQTSVPPEGGSYTIFPNDSVSPKNSVVSAFRRKDTSGQKSPDALVSMNCWRFDARIFEACRDVPRSARGEYELPEAVGLAVARGVRFRAIAAHGPVLDLSRRADAADVERRLAGVEPRP